MNLISRVVGGWNVRMTRNGKRTARFFADSKFGSKSAAMKAAQAHRDKLLASRPSPADRPAKPLLVIRDNAQYLQIRLPKPGGGTTTTEFSARRHGLKKARQLAIDAYNNARQRVAVKA